MYEEASTIENTKLQTHSLEDWVKDMNGKLLSAIYWKLFIV